MLLSGLLTIKYDFVSKRDKLGKVKILEIRAIEIASILFSLQTTFKIETFSVPMVAEPRYTVKILI